MSKSVVLVHGGLWDAMDAEAFWGTTGITGGLTSAGLTVLAPDRPRRPSGWDIERAALGELLANQHEPLTIVGASNGCTVAVLLALNFPHLVDHLLLAWPATAGDPALDARTRTGLIERGCPPDAADALLAGETLRGVTEANLARLATDAIDPVGADAADPVAADAIDPVGADAADPVAADAIDPVGADAAEPVRPDATGPAGAGTADPVGADVVGPVGAGEAGTGAARGRISVAVVPSVPENPAHQRKTVDALLRSIRGSRELAGCPEPPTPAFPPYLDQLVRTIVEFVN